MYSRIDFTCQHDQLIEDQHTATQVCLHCGRVMEENCNSMSPVIEEEKSMKLDQTGFNLIRDVCANNNISQCIEVLARDIYLKMMNKTRKRFKSRADLPAYALYQSFNRCNVPRGLDEVAALFHIPVTHLYGMDSKLDQSSIVNTRPSSLIGRFLSRLDCTIEHRSLKAMEERADNFFFQRLTSSPPRAVAAAVICLHLRKKYANGNCSMSTIAHACNVSNTCIKRLIKKMLDRPLTSAQLQNFKPQSVNCP